MWYWSIGWLLLLVWVEQSMAQSHGYDYWERIQDKALHLRADFKQKTVASKRFAKGGEWVPLQVQTYNEAGRLAREQYYQPYPSLLYDLHFTYLDDGTAEGLNVLDSNRVTYGFTETGLLNYYVDDRRNNIHIIYTYNEEQQLQSVKDCMAPFGNYHWCGYYDYQYDSSGRLKQIQSYNLGTGLPLDSVKLFRTDSLVYNARAQLTERWTLDPQNQLQHRTLYTYNRKGQLQKEQGQQLKGPENLSYLKTYRYHCNGQLKARTERFYTDQQQDARQERRYNRRGWLRSQTSYNQGQRPVVQLRLTYE